MLQVARLAPRLLGDSRDLVESFLRSQLNRGGGFANRAGDSDLYYTVFGLEALIALQAEPPIAQVERYLRELGNGDGLDFVHLACLVRCWAGVTRDLPLELLNAALARLEEYRSADGGYNQARGSKCGTAYAAFLALGAYQDAGLMPPNAERLLDSVATLRSEDGAFSNIQDAKSGVTPATAAVVTLFRQFGQQPEPQLARWLLARCLPAGGFFAMEGAPIPDLLSTATALHALSGMHASLSDVREPCLDFVDSLWTNRGGFYGHWSDDAIDTEYTYYALLALGHLTE